VHAENDVLIAATEFERSACRAAAIVFVSRRRRASSDTHMKSTV